MTGQRMNRGVPYFSYDGRFMFILQDDGNLVLYGESGPLWASKTLGKSGAYMEMQGDGNFVMYDSSGRALWATGTYHSPGSYLAIQNDGNVVIYDSANTAIWSTR